MTRLQTALLDWYDAHARTLPWRAPPTADRKTDPYFVWLSEVMLQQTTVPHATPYFLDFTRRWPTVADLAAARDEDVMAAWAGLGYYARARNLLTCARVVASLHGGVFPDTEAALRALPGVGAYTAAAVAAIAFGRATNVVDGNVERVMARVFRVETPLPAAKVELATLAATLVESRRPGDWAQALMDLGATVCRPRAPLCDRCPIQFACAAFVDGTPESYPRKAPKSDRPRRYGVAFVLRKGDQIALIRRPPKGLLGGMLALPTSDWGVSPMPDAQATAAAPVKAAWRDVGAIEHVFTHFSLSLRVFEARGDWDKAEWSSDLSALPSVFLKAARLSLP
jgi:A/G-specific adenine glycosylase